MIVVVFIECELSNLNGTTSLGVSKYLEVIPLRNCYAQGHGKESLPVHMRLLLVEHVFRREGLTHPAVPMDSTANSTEQGEKKS